MSRDKQKGTSLSLRWLLIIPVIMGLVITSCGDTPVDSQTDFVDSSQVNNDINMVPDQFDAVGTIQGTVIDKATGEALSDVAVSLNFMPEDAEEPSILTDTTGSEGTYSFTGVPVNTDYSSDGSGSEHDNSPYTLKVTTENLDNYRDLYRMNALLTFEATSGDGAATNLVSDITIPLSEQAVMLKGKAHTSDDAVLSDAKVELYQEFNPIINGDSDTETDMLVDSATTDSDGNFSFEGVEEKADVWLRFKDDSDPSEVVNMDYTINDETPSADGTEPEMDLGLINVNSSNESGAFYVTDVAPSPEANIGEDQTFMYVFNRPVAENAYTDASASFGVGSMKDDIQFDYIDEKSFDKSPGDIEFDFSWNDSRDTLFVEPEVSTMKDGSEYQLEVDAFDDDRFVDEHDNMITWGASEYDAFDVENLNFFTNFNASAPHTVELAVDSTGNHPDSDWDTGQHTIEWTMTNDPAEVKEYEIFISRDDGAYQHVQTVSAEDANHGELDYDFYATSNPNWTDGQNDTPDWINTYSTNGQILITNEDDPPVDEAHSHKVKVRAVSKNLVEGEFSNEITVEDVVSPGIEAYTETDDADIYVSVEEPLDKGTAEIADNFTVTDDTNGELSISSVSYDRGNQDNPNGQTGFDIVITVDDASNLTTGDIEISSDVTDLSGNDFDTNDNTTNY